MQACPDGWRLPTDEEWVEMIQYYDPGFDPQESSSSIVAYKTHISVKKILVPVRETFFEETDANNNGTPGRPSIPSRFYEPKRFARLTRRALSGAWFLAGARLWQDCNGLAALHSQRGQAWPIWRRIMGLRKG